MSFILDKLVRFAFERIPGISALNGYKTQIGQWLMVVAAAIVAAKQEWPSINELDGIMLVIGFVLEKLGMAHKSSKAKE
jgi:hypothetical protein